MEPPYVVGEESSIDSIPAGMVEVRMRSGETMYETGYTAPRTVTNSDGSETKE